MALPTDVVGLAGFKKEGLVVACVGGDRQVACRIGRVVEIALGRAPIDIGAAGSGKFVVWWCDRLWQGPAPVRAGLEPKN